MANRWKNALTSADITPYDAFLNRRQMISGTLGFGLVTSTGIASAAQPEMELNSWDDITQYNNFYEFGTGKEDPAE